MKFSKLVGSMIAANLLAISGAHATNGYLSHGYGVKAQGMAGVGIALPQDGLAAATNPAGTAFVGDRVDIGVTYFRPSRNAKISGNNAMTPMGPTSLDGSYDGNDTQNYLVPEIGYTKQLSSKLGVGIAVYGNGGMATDYENNPFANFGGSGNAGVDLSQLFISPSIAYKVTENHAIGAAVNFAYQRFKMEGVQPFVAFGVSSSGGDFTNNGYDSSIGWGIRLGYTGKIMPNLTLGLTWASKTYMDEFDKYKGLFAEQGGFDIPSNYGIGLAWQVSNNLVLAADVQRIDYGSVKSIGNPIEKLFVGNLFGTNDGPGFGWKDVTVGKIGAAYQTGDWTVRGGYSYATQPVPDSQAFLNIFAPGVVQHHLSFGATWAQGKSGELSFGYTHAFKNTVKGEGAIPANFGGGDVEIDLAEDMFGVAYAWKF
ncbi:MAG: outer membrane protein transport protein [Rhodocyclaceae bacterium]|nr:outer membrane protein transport protein [Rhodocyclaceae bacterium]